jgi:hypothetical protein
MWIYINNKFKELKTKKDLSRLILTHPYNTERKAKYVHKPTDWIYVYYGQTKEQCLENVNYDVIFEINYLNDRILYAQSRLVKE